MDSIPYYTCSCFCPRSYQTAEGPQSHFISSYVTTHTIPAAVSPSQPKGPKAIINPDPNPGFSYWFVLYVLVAVFSIIFVVYGRKIQRTSAGGAENPLNANPDGLERKDVAALRVSTVSKDGGLTTGTSKKKADGKETSEVKSGGGVGGGAEGGGAEGGGGGTGPDVVAGAWTGTGTGTRSGSGSKNGTTSNPGTATDSRLRGESRRTEGTTAKAPPPKAKGPKADYAW